MKIKYKLISRITFSSFGASPFPLSDCGEDCLLDPLTGSALCSGDAGGDLG